MPPLEKILALYHATNSPHAFADDLASHLRHGVVIATPEFLILARPVSSQAPVEQINNPHHAFPAATCDTWYIYAFAGRMTSALRHLPYPLPYLAFERANQNGLRFHPLEPFLKKCAALLAA